MYLNDEELKAFIDKEDGQNKCGRCLFWCPYEPPNWRRIGGESARFLHYRGDCRRHAPVIVNVKDCEPTTGWWPETDWDDWCGDFETDSSSLFDATTGEAT